MGRTILRWQWLFVLAATATVALVAAPGRADAAVSSCTVSSTGIIFSAYQTPNAVDGSGTITVSCTGSGNNNAVALHITGGNANSCTARVMKSGTNSMGYQIYKDAARTARFCNGTDRLDLSFSFSGGLPTSQTINVYGRVTASQNPVYTTSNYTDSLTVTARAGTSATGTVLGSGTFSLTGSVAAICSVSAGTLGFGAYSGAQVNSTASVSVNCSNGAGYQVSLGGGTNQSGSLRRMAGPSSNLLTYELYSNSLRTTPWGDGSAALGARFAGTGSGAAQALTVYGRIPAGQTPAAGSYSDSVVVTVEY